MSRGRGIRILLGLAWLGWARAAPADVVQPPPENCPPGTYGATGHAGQYCLPRPCQDSGGCGDGMTCATRRLCVAEREYENMTGRGTLSVVEGSCDMRGCAKGECVARRVCIPPPTAVGEPPATASATAVPSAPETIPVAPERAEPSDEPEPEPAPRPAKPGPAAAGPLVAALLVALLAALGVWLWRRRKRA